MSFSKKEENVVATCSYDKILIWDLRQTQKESLLINTPSQMNKVMFDRGDNSHVLVTLDNDQVIRVWD